MNRYEEAIANGETAMDGWIDVGLPHPKSLWYAYRPDGFKVCAVDVKGLVRKMCAVNWGLALMVQAEVFRDQERAENINDFINGRPK